MCATNAVERGAVAESALIMIPLSCVCVAWQQLPPSSTFYGSGYTQVE